jgi:hypothetical protein
MFTKKKHLKVIASLMSVMEAEIETYKAAYAEIETYKAAYFEADVERREWRAKYELSQLNPEVKADVEAAFARGEVTAKKKLAAYLMTVAQTLANGGETE